MKNPELQLIWKSVSKMGGEWGDALKDFHAGLLDVSGEKDGEEAKDTILMVNCFGAGLMKGSIISSAQVKDKLEGILGKLKRSNTKNIKPIPNEQQ